MRIINKSFRLLLPPLLVIGLVMTGFSARDALFTPMQLPAEGVTYRISEGMGLTSLADDLAATGMLSCSRWLTLYGRMTESEGVIKAGEYYLPTGMTPYQFLQKVRGGLVVQHQVTFLEGWSFRQLLGTLRRQAAIDHQLDGLSASEIMTRLDHAGENPEGRFFPDTYNYERGASDITILVTAYERMQKILADEWLLRGVDLPFETSYQALIMASIVEKESAVQIDRSRIAAVFIRRLNQGIRLQSDPTVIYGLGSEFSGDLRRADLSGYTPYNTYIHYGLPPTPISNPSRAAIHASLHPADVSSLYFVSRGDGTSQFSDTLQEHNRAVRKYQLNRAQQRRGNPISSPLAGKQQQKLNPAVESVVE